MSTLIRRLPRDTTLSFFFSAKSFTSVKPRFGRRYPPPQGKQQVAWTSQELYICARLLEDIYAYSESGSYYLAVYNSQGLPDAQERTRF